MDFPCCDDERRAWTSIVFGLVLGGGKTENTSFFFFFKS
jgi:hypothetical protein